MLKEVSKKDFLQQISSMALYDVLQLDYSKEEGKIPTLRQMIMSLKAKDGKLHYSTVWIWTGNRMASTSNMQLT